MKHEEFTAAYKGLIAETKRALTKQPENTTGASIGIKTRNGSRYEIGKIDYFDDISFDVYRFFEENTDGPFKDGLFVNGQPAPAFILYSDISVVFAAFIREPEKEN